MFPVPFSVTFSDSMFKISHIYMDCNCFVYLLLFSYFFMLFLCSFHNFPLIVHLTSDGLLRISCSFDAYESQKVFCPQ